MKLLERGISLYAPFSCLGCGDEGSAVCDWCWPEAASSLPSTCYRCNKLTQNYKTCSSCRSQSPLLRVWAPLPYKSVVKKLVRGLKYERRRAYASEIARLLDELLPYFSDPPLLTYLPTASTRRRRRGFDHARLIARELAKLRGWSCVTTLRRLDQLHQVGLSRTERLKSQLEFRICRSIIGQSVVVLDDVITTGRSIEAAARVLRSAGAKHVSAIAVGHNQRF